MSWPRRLLAFVLYAAIMLAIGWVLKQTVPGALDWLYGLIGRNAVTVAMIGLWLAGLIYVMRDSARRRRLRGPHG